MAHNEIATRAAVRLACGDVIWIDCMLHSALNCASVEYWRVSELSHELQMVMVHMQDVHYNIP